MLRRPPTIQSRCLFLSGIGPALLILRFADRVTNDIAQPFGQPIPVSAEDAKVIVLAEALQRDPSSFVNSPVKKMTPFMVPLAANTFELSQPKRGIGLVAHQRR